MYDGHLLKKICFIGRGKLTLNKVDSRW